MPQAVNTPLYLNWSFWAVIVAFLAVVLSQLPPVKHWFKLAKIDLELYSRIHITHKVGNPNVQLHLIISNIGGKAVKIKGITATILRDGKIVAVLPAQNYLQHPNDKSNILFTRFSMKPGEEWPHNVNCLNYFSREEEKLYRNSESILKADIAAKREIPGNKDKIVEADSKNIVAFTQMFNKNFIWQPGEYEILISVDTVPKRAAYQKRYRFTLFESDSNDLAKLKDEYKFGDGIFWDSVGGKGVLVQITEA